MADAVLRRGQLAVAHPHQPVHTSAYHLLRPAQRRQDGALPDFMQWLSQACELWSRRHGLARPVA